MSMTLKLSPDTRKKLGLGETATAEQIVAALSKHVDGKSLPDQAKLAVARKKRAANRARRAEEAVYDRLFKGAGARAAATVDATEGLSTEDAALYRELFGPDN